MKNFLITGDTTLDHYFLTGNRTFSDSAKDLQGSNYYLVKGGAGLVHQFLRVYAKDLNMTLGFDQALFDNLPPQNKSYATISLYKWGKDNKETRLRISSQFGFGKPTGKVDYAKSKPVSSFSGIDLAIIDDAGMEFGSLVNQKKAWPWMAELNKGNSEIQYPCLVICKKSGNLKRGELWKELLAASREKKINLIGIVTASDIRRQDARVSSKISWEQAALDLVYELKNNINLYGLTDCRLLVVTFGSSGAIIISNNGSENLQYKLVFDSSNLEDEWEEKTEGGMIGKMSCFTAAFAAQLDLSKPGKDYLAEEATIKGLAAIRGLYDTGYAVLNAGIGIESGSLLTATDVHILKYTSAYIPEPGNDPSFLDKPWSILLDNHIEQKNSKNTGPGAMFELARRIITNGHHVLNNVPSNEYGKLHTVDRNEIESLRNIKVLMENYRNQKTAKIPLSIAVFGLPGSGKSFSVKQIGKGVLGKEVPILEFNLSQFAGPADLIGAFHQVRDEILKGSTPIVFFDEFDSKNYEWLQYLLAPMQDGSFQEGQVTHFIGKCIMVFAGGTSYKMEFFGDFDGNKQKIEDFKLKKGPDFISRIHGYVNIIGPNPGLRKNVTTKTWETDPEDRCYPIRRGLFIRQMLDLKDKEVLDIDWGLLNAMLKVGKYKHGSRSLENLLKNLKENSDGRKILRSHLPSNAILNLLIEDVESFFKLMNENLEYHIHAFEIAKCIHEAWSSNSKTKNPDYDTEFDMLPVFIKASNLAAAIRIPQVLGKGKLKLVHKGEMSILSENVYKAYIKEKGFLEEMAEEEHRLWREFYENNDWKYNKKRNDYLKLHNCLVDYNDPDLKDADKDKDRDQILKYWKFLDQAGFGIAVE